jgi:L-alanine-DL-glutamate epimerase-like enolase superfamily enzyme
LNASRHAAASVVEVLIQLSSDEVSRVRIEKITVYTGELSYAGKAYSFSQGRIYTAFPTTVVALKTNTGITGYGEVCPCGPAYMPAYAEGVIPALEQLAPVVLGEDPTHTLSLMRRMDLALNGHGFAKTPIDLACWDILGKHSELPVHVFLGGRMMESIPIHRVVPLGTPDETLASVDELRARGYGHFQIKLGLGVAEDIATMQTVCASARPGEVFVGDANAAWNRTEAIRISRGLREQDCMLEQPCTATVDCITVRPQLLHPVKLDESLGSLAEVRAAIAANAMDAIAIKLSKFGGITRSRVIRDLCVDAGIAMTIEEAWGSGIASAASAHLAISTAPEALLNGTDIHNYNSNQIAHGAPEVRPGLGTEPDFDALGDPVREFKR